jgi:hypothetical protein
MDGPRSLLDEQLRAAIAGKRLVQLRYHGDRRLVPHDYGVNNGIERWLVYQRRGVSRSATRSAIGWRLLEVAQIEDCRILDETFGGSRGEPQQKHMEWDVLYARVG